uniref:GPI inositol-deacylase n=1 Tax=Peronospora matthiolae TaxID=2874970 RepID=A0AAV1U8R0_9STRA
MAWTRKRLSFSFEPVRHHHEPQLWRRESASRPGRQWVFWRLAVVAVVGCFLAVTQVTNYTHHFHAHLAKHRILRNLQEQPALRLTFELKRKAMYVHGASTFDVFAVPAPKRSVDDGSMVYDGIASFEKDGDWYDYTLVDGITYYTVRSNEQEVQSGCLPSGSVPPIHSVLDAIQTAITANPLSSSNDKCPHGSVMVFQFAGEDFVLCSGQSSWSWVPDDGFEIFGKDLNIRVKYEQTAPTIVAPRVSTEELTFCGAVPFGDRISTSLPSMLSRSFLEWGHRALRAESAQFNLFEKAWDLVTDDGCGCKGVRRVCVFIPGLNSFGGRGLTDKDPHGYFGDDIGDHSPCCLSRKFITLTTKDNHWSSLDFQQRLVDLLLEVSSTSDKATKTVKDTIIVGHSMANLILSGAIAEKSIVLDPSTTWVALSTPMQGSMGSNYIQESCHSDKGGFVASIIDLLGNCPVTTGEASVAYQNSTFSTRELDNAYAAAQAAYAANVDAVVCSNSFMGLVTIKSTTYVLAGKILPHHSPKNDGIVEYSSCAMGLPLETFGKSYKSPRYLAELNHVDTSFRNGDGVFSDAKKPLKWFECLL